MTRQAPLAGATVRAVMIFAADPPTEAAWYASVFGLPGVSFEANFAYVDAGDVEIGFQPADEEKNPHGRSTVVYWAVPSLTAARAALLEAGATPHRGPLRVDDGRSICQLVDPFGHVFGLDGPL